jgi:uncharacterized membrane protein YidH (DUF202 family)
METKQRNLSIHDTVGSEPPVAVLTATAAWFVAVGAGIAESVVGALSADDMPAAVLIAQIAIRSVVYGGLFIVIDRYFRHGHNWSRHLLGVLLGIVGMATLVVGPAGWLIDNGDFSTVDVTASFILSVVLRSVHIAAVVAGVVLMYQSEANRWFRAVR